MKSISELVSSLVASAATPDDLRSFGVSTRVARRIIDVRDASLHELGPEEIRAIEGVGTASMQRLVDRAKLIQAEDALPLLKELRDAWESLDDGHMDAQREANDRALDIANAMGSEQAVHYAKAVNFLYEDHKSEALDEIKLAREDITEEDDLTLWDCLILLDYIGILSAYRRPMEALGVTDSVIAGLHSLSGSVIESGFGNSDSVDWLWGFAKWLVRHRRAAILANLYRYREAIQSYDEATAIGSRVTEFDEEFHRFPRASKNNKANILFQQGRIGEAHEMFEELASQNPGHPLYLNNLGFLMFVTGRTDEAHAKLRDGLQLAQDRDDNQGHLSYNLGLAHKRIADTDAEANRQVELSASQNHFEVARLEFTKERDLLLALTADFTRSHIGKQRMVPAEYAVPVADLDRKRVIAQEILMELLNDVDNFITDGKVRSDLYTDFLLRGRTVDPAAMSLRTLRRWNSFTPGIPLPRDIDVPGGGYFVTWGGKGIVVDPGFNFISNFSAAGLALADIDMILVSHAHIDHTADLEPLVTLLAEKRKREGTGGATGADEHKITLGMSIGTLNKQNVGWLLLETHLIDPIHVLTKGGQIGLDENCSVKVLEASHADIASEHTAIGLRFESEQGGVSKVLTISCDTAYTDEIAQQYEGSDILVLHVGTTTFAELAAFGEYSLDAAPTQDIFGINPRFVLESYVPDIEDVLGYREFDSDEDKTYEERIQKFKRLLTGVITEEDKQDVLSESHLMFNGLYEIIDGLSEAPKLILISEYGEELGPSRLAIAAVFNRHLQAGSFGNAKRQSRCLTADIGLELRWDGLSPEIRCELCGKWVEYRGVVETCSRREDLCIKHICTNCAAGTNLLDL